MWIYKRQKRNFKDLGHYKINVEFDNFLFPGKNMTQTQKWQNDSYAPVMELTSSRMRSAPNNEGAVGKVS